MVNVTTTVMTPSQRQKARLQRIKDAAPQKPGLRVEPRDETMRRLLKHPRAGGFRSDGSVEWPDDTFTYRRLKEGSIKLEQSADKPVTSPQSADKPVAPPLSAAQDE